MLVNYKWFKKFTRHPEFKKKWLSIMKISMYNRYILNFKMCIFYQEKPFYLLQKKFDHWFCIDCNRIWFLFCLW